MKKIRRLLAAVLVFALLVHYLPDFGPWKRVGSVQAGTQWEEYDTYIFLDGDEYVLVGAEGINQFCSLGIEGQLSDPFQARVVSGYTINGEGQYIEETDAISLADSGRLTFDGMTGSVDLNGISFTGMDMIITGGSEITLVGPGNVEGFRAMVDEQSTLNMNSNGVFQGTTGPLFTIGSGTVTLSGGQYSCSQAMFQDMKGMPLSVGQIMSFLASNCYLSSYENSGVENGMKYTATEMKIISVKDGEAPVDFRYPETLVLGEAGTFADTFPTVEELKQQYQLELPKGLNYSLSYSSRVSESGNEIVRVSNPPEESGEYTVYLEGILEGEVDTTIFTVSSDFTLLEPGSGSLQMDGWIYGETPGEPVIDSTTNDVTDAVILYRERKAEGEPEAEFTETVPSEVGFYEVKAILPQTDFFKELELTDTFDIAYLELDSPFTLSGDEGKNGWYTSDVVIFTSDLDYELILPGFPGEGSSNMVIGSTGTVKFVVRNKETKGQTDVFSVDLSIDKKEPEILVSLSEGEPEDGDSIYQGSIALTVSDDNLASVSINGLQQSVTGTSFLTSLVEDGDYTILAEDRAGLTSRFTATIQKPKSEVKAAGNASLVQPDWYYGTGRPAMILRSSTNDTNSAEIFFKQKNAADSTYSKTVPENVGTYTVKAVLPANETYREVAVTTDFTISYKEMPEDVYSLDGTTTDGSWYGSDVLVKAKTGYQIRFGTEGVWSDSVNLTDSGTYGFSVREADTGAISRPLSLELKLDRTEPECTGEGEGILLGSYVWKDFSESIPFEIYFKEAANVKIDGHDSESDIYRVEYMVVNEPLTKEQLENSNAWKTGDTVSIHPGDREKVIVYGKLTNYAGLSTYLSSIGIVMDDVRPSVENAEDNMIYYEDHMKIRIEDSFFDYITVNGERVEIGADNYVDLDMVPGDDVYTLVAVDKSGNRTEINFSIYEAWEKYGIQRSGSYRMVKGRGYKLGAGSWSVNGDGMQYNGGTTIYPASQGVHKFSN